MVAGAVNWFSKLTFPRDKVSSSTIMGMNKIIPSMETVTSAINSTIFDKLGRKLTTPLGSSTTDNVGNWTMLTEPFPEYNETHCEEAARVLDEERTAAYNHAMSEVVREARISGDLREVRINQIGREVDSNVLHGRRDHLHDEECDGDDEDLGLSWIFDSEFGGLITASPRQEVQEETDRSNNIAAFQSNPEHEGEEEEEEEEVDDDDDDDDGLVLAPWPGDQEGEEESSRHVQVYWGRALNEMMEMASSAAPSVKLRFQMMTSKVLRMNYAMFHSHQLVLEPEYFLIGSDRTDVLEMSHEIRKHVSIFTTRAQETADNAHLTRDMLVGTGNQPRMTLATCAW